MTRERQWTPRPIDTADVALPVALERLVELLAQNAHDTWAKQRLDDGWVWGERDDKARTHPDLVPYEDLPEGEKTYDRLLVVETLKVMLKLGCRIDCEVL
jgi:RyR domain